ncbi:hypothetical protein F558DRAFT_03744 [Streptomyces sp. AmelKG-A3]|nr:hypothetical protein GA0115247_10327 [Streptomyces sp. PalvLS-984]SDD27619.1 hypothetical protein F558DRAFT_03744 [Streptomyces sp. AmelKG-A3]
MNPTEASGAPSRSTNTPKFSMRVTNPATTSPGQSGTRKSLRALEGSGYVTLRPYSARPNIRTYRYFGCRFSGIANFWPVTSLIDSDEMTVLMSLKASSRRPVSWSERVPTWSAKRTSPPSALALAQISGAF